jgi:hypothetical protein
MAIFLFVFICIGSLVACGAVYAVGTLINRKKSGWNFGKI